MLSKAGHAAPCFDAMFCKYITCFTIMFCKIIWRTKPGFTNTTRPQFCSFLIALAPNKRKSNIMLSHNTLSDTWMTHLLSFTTVYLRVSLTPTSNDKTCMKHPFTPSTDLDHTSKAFSVWYRSLTMMPWLALEVLNGRIMVLSISLLGFSFAASFVLFISQRRPPCKEIRYYVHFK